MGQTPPSNIVQDVEAIAENADEDDEGEEDRDDPRNHLDENLKVAIVEAACFILGFIHNVFLVRI